VGGLYSPEFVMAPWSWAKFLDLMNHIWVVLVIVGLADTAGTIRVMRAKMLDTLGEPYIDTARMKGLSSTKIYFRHALRVAINPIVSSVGLRFPQIISGSTIVSIVLTLPLIGPLLLESLRGEDVYLACSILVMLTLALIVGNFIADLALAWLDPRIRYES
jgi:peptide/nickel transport system permease protein